LPEQGQYLKETPRRKLEDNIKMDTLKQGITKYGYGTFIIVEHFLLPTDAHNVKKRRVIKTF